MDRTCFFAHITNDENRLHTSTCEVVCRAGDKKFVEEWP